MRLRALEKSIRPQSSAFPIISRSSPNRYASSTTVRTSNVLCNATWREESSHSAPQYSSDLSLPKKVILRSHERFLMPLLCPRSILPVVQLRYCKPSDLSYDEEHRESDRISAPSVSGPNPCCLYLCISYPVTMSCAQGHGHLWTCDMGIACL